MGERRGQVEVTCLAQRSIERSRASGCMVVLVFRGQVWGSDTMQDRLTSGGYFIVEITSGVFGDVATVEICQLVGQVLFLLSFLICKAKHICYVPYLHCLLNYSH